MGATQQWVVLVLVLFVLFRIGAPAKEKKKKVSATTNGGGGQHPAYHPDWSTLPYDALVKTCQSLNLPTDGTVEALAARLSQHFALNAGTPDNNSARFNPYIVPGAHGADGSRTSNVSAVSNANYFGAGPTLPAALTTDFIAQAFSAQTGAVPGASVAQMFNGSFNPLVATAGGPTVSLSSSSTTLGPVDGHNQVLHQLPQHAQQQQLLQQQSLQQQFQHPSASGGSASSIPQHGFASLGDVISYANRVVYSPSPSVPVSATSVTPVHSAAVGAPRAVGHTPVLPSFTNAVFASPVVHPGVVPTRHQAVGHLPPQPVSSPGLSPADLNSVLQSLSQSITANVLNAISGVGTHLSPSPAALPALHSTGQQLPGAAALLPQPPAQQLSLFSQPPVGVGGAAALLPQQQPQHIVQVPHPQPHPSLFTSNQAPSGSSFPGVPQRFIQQIQRGECINFNALFSALVCGATEKAGYSFVLGGLDEADMPVVSLKKSSDSSRKIKNFAEWLRTWSTFLSVFIQFRPHLVPQLVAYQNTMARHATMVCSAAWLAYDAAFRQKLANNPFLRWDVEDVELYNAYVRAADVIQPSAPSASKSNGACFNCGKFGHWSSACPYASRVVNQVPRPKPVPKSVNSSQVDGNDQPFRGPPRSSSAGGTCSKWNDGASCPADCPRDHRCSFCHKLHPRSSCKHYNNQG